MSIGRLEPVPIREVWKKEEKDFTPWLERNIDILAEKLGIELSPVEREKKAGMFETDLLAEDQNSDPVIIECQFGKSDHDHLGKVLTYLTQLNAKTVIWLCEDPRPEHIGAISWLNEVAPQDVSFYLIRIESYRIGNSPPAPHFVVLSQPSMEAKTTGQVKKDLAERHKKRLEFWEGLLGKSRSRGIRLFENVKPSKENWIGTGSGKSGLWYNYVILMHASRVELYIDTGDGDENKRIFDQLFSQKKEIEAKGIPIVWQRLDDKRASRIYVQVSENIGLRDEDKWDKLQNDMIDTMVKFEEALGKRVQNMM